MDINLVLALFAGGMVIFSAFSAALQKASLPGPLLALVLGVLIGPYALGLLRIDDFGVEQGTLLEQACRLTLGIGLAGVALRLPHGYWRSNARWVALMITLGMTLMFAVAAGILWVLAGLPFLVALLIGAIVTPTDPIISTPIVTGSVAKQNIPDKVRFNISSESGLNDGLAYLFVLLPVLLITKPGQAWEELLAVVLLREVLGAALFGVFAGWALAKLFVLVRGRDLMEESSYMGFVVPAALLVLGAGKLLGTDAVLAVFVAAAVFGQLIPQQDEEQEGKVDDVINRFFILPLFILLGLALPVSEWIGLGIGAMSAVAAAVMGRRMVALLALRPLLKRLHTRAETAFLSWFGPIGVSALFYATLAERHTGNREIFVYVTFAITLSVLIHGLSSSPLSYWLHRRQRDQKPVKTGV
ncbi:MAG: cation:proton antiporter [Actinomycetes bacterium]